MSETKKVILRISAIIVLSVLYSALIIGLTLLSAYTHAEWFNNSICLITCIVVFLLNLILQKITAPYDNIIVLSLISSALAVLFSSAAYILLSEIFSRNIRIPGASIGESAVFAAANIGYMSLTFFAVYMIVYTFAKIKYRKLVAAVIGTLICNISFFLISFCLSEVSSFLGYFIIFCLGVIALSLSVIITLLYKKKM